MPIIYENVNLIVQYLEAKTLSKFQKESRPVKYEIYIPQVFNSNYHSKVVFYLQLFACHDTHKRIKPAPRFRMYIEK